MSVWDEVATLEAEENVGDSVWDKAGGPLAEKQELYRNLTDTLLDNKHIESFLATKLPNTPLGYEPVPEDKDRLFAVIEKQENPKEFRDKLAVSLYLANSYDMEFRDIYNRYDAISKELWGKITPAAALEKILKADRDAFGLNRTIDYKGWGEATKHAYSQAGLGLVSEIAGLARAVGELRSGWSAGQVEWAENTADWGDMMYKGVEEYYRQHPEEFIQAKGDGFWDTTFEYLSHPVAIYQGVLQTTPLTLEGIAGGMVAGGLAATLGAGAKATKFASWLGRVQGMAAPITGRKYAELRSMDIAPSRALPQAFLTGQTEAIIEEWTLGKKLAIFKGAGAGAKKAISGRVLAAIIGGSKAYGRGVLEEGSQRFSENFWNWVFTNRDQKWMNDVMSQAAAGGPMEAVMAGGFAVAGKGYAALRGEGQVSAEEKLRRIEAVREIMLQAELTPEEANEINKVCDDVKIEIEGEALAAKEEILAPAVELQIAGESYLVDIINTLPNEIKQVLDIQSISQLEFPAERQGEGGRWIREKKQILIEEGIVGDELYETVIHEALHDYTDKVNNTAFMVDFINGYYTRASQETRDEYIEYAKQRGKPTWDMHSQEVFTNTLSDYILGKATTKWDADLQKTLLPVFDKYIGKKLVRPAKEETKPEPQNVSEEIDQAEVPPEIDQAIPELEITGEERVAPNLYIGNVTGRMKKVFGKIWGKDPSEVKPFIEGGFPTKRTRIEISRQEAQDAHDELVSFILDALDNNQIRTENDLALANAFWGDIVELRQVLGLPKAARPFKVIRAEKHDMRLIKNTKSRIYEAIRPTKPSEMTIGQVLRAVMKGMSKAAQTAYMAGARETVDLHKNLNKYAREQLKGLDMSAARWKRLMNAIAGARTQAQRIAAKATIDILAEQTRQAEAIKKLKKTVAYINRKIGVVMQKHGIREEFYTRIKALTDTFLVKPNSAKQQRAVRSLKIHLENLQKNTSNKYESQYETEIIPDSLIKRLDKINAVPIQKMTAEQVENLNDTLKLLVHLNNTKNRLIKDSIARDLTKVLNGAVEELDNVNDISIDENKRPTTEQETGKYGALHSFITVVAGAKNHDIETLVDTLCGGQKGWAYEVFVEGMAEGREKAYGYANQIRDEFKSTMAEASIDLADLQKMSKSFLRILKGKRGMSMRRFLGDIFGSELTPTLHTIKIAGAEQQFTMAELMMIYMHAQADFNLRALIDQGTATWKKRLGKMTPAEIATAADIVEQDPKAKAFVDMAARVYGTISKDAINGTSIPLIGISLAKEDNYAHVERYKTGGVAGAQRYRLSDLEQEGRLQPRIGSKEPIIIRDFFEVFFNDIQAISQYVGMAEPLRNARNLVNYKQYRDILRDKGYAEQLALLDQMLHNVQALPEAGDAIDAVASFLMRGTVRAVLAEPGIFLGQYTSLNGVFNETDRKYSSAIKVAATEKDKSQYKEHFPSYKARLEGGVSSVTLSYLAQNDAVLRAFTGKADFISTFTRLIHEVDSLAITDICRIAEAEMQDTNRQGRAKDYWQDRGIDPSQLEVGSQEYWDAFVKRASYLIRRTQPMFTPENRSVFTANKSAAKRMWFLFRSYVDQPLRMGQRSITAYKHGKISLGQLSADLANIWVTLALYSVIRFGVAFALYRKDDDWKDLLLDMTLAPVRMLTLIGFPVQIVIEQAFEATRAPEIGAVPVTFANQVAESLTWLAKGAGHLVTEERYKSGPNKGKLKASIEIQRGLLGLLENALMFFGIPEDVPRRTYKGWTKKEKRVKYKAF
jgi:hypothetical protein